MLYENVIKPFMDFLVAFILIVILFPVFVILALLLALVNKGNPFFCQKRPGLDGDIFMLIKFKTMSDAKDGSGNLLPDKDRLTYIGKIVRKTSLDELPQLFNVLMGDMSMIGPRPLLIQYLPLYTKHQSRRHEVKPGITGWAQVNGRNAISWEEKFELDVWYVDNISVFLDLKIFFLTIKKVLIKEGINTTGEATTKPFKGTNSH